MWDAEGRYHGEESKKPLIGRKFGTDPNFKGISEEPRKFHDVLFGILFILAFATMIAISVLGFVKGDPARLIPADHQTEVQEAQPFFQEAVAQMKTDKYVLLGAIGVAFVVGAVWIQLLKWFTKLFVYLTIFGGILAMIAAGVYVLIVGIRKDNSDVKIVSYVIFGIAFLMAVAVVFLRKKIALTTALFAECCRGIQHNPTIFLIATIVVALFTAFIGFWSTSFVFLFSVVDDEFSAHTGKIEFNTKIRNLMYFNVFVLFWVCAFLIAVFKMSVAGGIASWYFSRDASGVPQALSGPATLKTFGRAWTKSFGSLALGSLVLAVVEFLNFLLEKVKKTPGNRYLRIFVCIAQCLLGCVAKLVQFINRFAYIHIAMHGESFCASARNCFELVGRNLFSVAVIDVLGKFVLFVGKILGTSVCVIYAIATLDMMGKAISPVTIALVVVIAWVILSIFAHIVGAGVDTVFVCYLEDLERNGQNGTLLVDPSLHTLLQQKAVEMRPVESN